MGAFVLHVFLALLFETGKGSIFDEELSTKGTDDDLAPFVAALSTLDSNEQLDFKQRVHELDEALDEVFEDVQHKKDGRKSLLTTQCWKLGGICVRNELCQGSRFLTQVRGCKNKLNVCCFKWNQYRVRDLRDKGASFGGYPWKSQPSFYLNRHGNKLAIKGVRNAKKRKRKGKIYEATTKDDNEMFLNQFLKANAASKHLDMPHDDRSVEVAGNFEDIPIIIEE